MTGGRRFEPGIILEGGQSRATATGTVLTTEQCLLNPNRNPELSLSDVERYLCRVSATQCNVVMARRRNPGRRHRRAHRRARAVCEPDHRRGPLGRRHKRPEPRATPRKISSGSSRCATRMDRPLDLVPLPMPRAMHYEGQRLPASLLQFLYRQRRGHRPGVRRSADAPVMDLSRSCSRPRSGRACRPATSSGAWRVSLHHAAGAGGVEVA